MAGRGRPQQHPRGASESTVRDALRRRAGQLEERAGRIAPRSASGFEIGPQRYHDPEIWGPNYELRGARLGSTNTPQQVAAMQRTPPTADEGWRDAVRFVAELEADLDAQGITEARVLCLVESLQRPDRYVQRCVEHVAFPTQGGQRWTRHLQARTPETPDPASASWRIAPLGQFIRRHFPDFAALDWDGRRLNLLTRDQHGLALVKAILLRQIDSLPADGRARLREPDVRAAYGLLRTRLLAFMTTVGDFADPERSMTAVVFPYEQLLSRLGMASGPTEQRIADLANQLAELLESVPSLCWILAKPGEILNLEVSYTTRDPRHNPAYDGAPPSAHAAPGDSYASTRADLYRDLGLGPIKHEFDAPSPRHVGSYSFTIEPPQKTSLMYLDWEIGNSLDRDETVTCSLDSAYLPDDGDGIAVPSAGTRVRAFLRVSPYQRVQILAAAILNLVVVWLLRDGHVPGPFDPVQGFILAAPSGLIAYLVGQQRHYYAYPMRRQRGILWGYLAISIVFLVAVALGAQQGSTGNEELGPIATVVAWILFASSVAVFFWYLPLGFGFNWVVAYFTRRRWARRDAHDQKWETYVAVYQRYGRVVFYVVLTAALAAFWFLALAWDGSPSDRRAPPQARSVLVSGGQE